MSASELPPSRDDGAVAGPTQRLAERLGPYRLIQRIGEGGMGIVYFALDPTGRAVAIKVLRPHVSYDDEARARLQRELDSLSRINHPRVAPVIDADIHGPRPYLVTRFIDGDALDDAVTAYGPLRGEALLRLARGLFGALDAIHAEGIVHRDLKPGNVLVGTDGDPVLIDFGIAHLDDDVRLTSTGLVMGTPGYLAPEVIEGEPVTPATDWWGWAATLAYAATGRPPFGRGGMDVVLTRVRAGECDLSGVDPGLEPLLAAALSPRPDERPSAATVLAGLERYAAGGSATAVLPEEVGPTAEVSVRHTQVMSEQPDWRYAVPASWEALPGDAGSWEPPPWSAPTGPPPGWEPRGVSPQAAAPHGAGPRVGPQGLQGASPQGPQGPQGAGPQGAGPQGPQGAGPQGPPEWQQWNPSWDQPWEQAAPPPAPVSITSTTGGAEGAAADPRIGQPQKSGLLAATVALLAAMAAVTPVVAVLVGLGWAWAARFVDRTVTSLVMRRFEHGRRRRDVPVTVVMSPVHVAAAGLAAAVAALLPLVIGLATVVSVALAVAAVTGGSPTPGGALGFGAGMVAAVVTAWWGPGGAGLRRGSRSMARTVGRPGLVGEIVVGVLVAGALGLGVWAVLRGGASIWWPLNSAPGLFAGR
ncbi:MAG: protein kinase [Dermatophilaceae bacterium]|nr:protein kinase [Dermatophilaceae bacterium]